METQDSNKRLEEQIGEWRGFLRHRQAIHPVDVEELEDHLREQVSALLRADLTEDEAFLIAVKRIGDLDSLSREFAREHSERLWKQLVVSPGDSGEAGTSTRREAVVAFGLAALAAIAFKVPELFGLTLDGDEGFYARNVSLFVFPLLAGFFVWKRRAGSATWRWLAAGVRNGRRIREHLSVRARGLDRDPDRDAPADRAVAGRRRRLRGRGWGEPGIAHGLRPLLGESSSTTC